MLKRVMLGALALVAAIGLAAAVYLLRLTAPIEVSSTPPVAATIEVASSSSPGTAGASSMPPETRLYRIDPARSKASYSVEETFFSARGLVTAVGTTGAVAGDILVDRSNLALSRISEIVVDISQLRTDEPARDNAIRRKWLESARYPLATFKNSTFSHLPTTWAEGQPFTFRLTGDMTVREQTRRVTWSVQATLAGDELRANATTRLKMSDFGIDPPSLSDLKVEDEIALSLELVAAAVAEAGARATPSAEAAASPQSCSPSRQGPTTTSPIDEAPVRSSVGKGHVLSGVVRSTNGCAPIAGARIIFWLTNPQGVYDEARRATVYTDKAGAYTFESNFPGQYGGSRPHIHFYVSADGHEAVELETFPVEGQPRATFDVVLAARTNN